MRRRRCPCRRRTWSTWSTGRTGRTWTGGGGANLVADFLNAGPPDFVEHSDYVSVECHAFSAD